jgi:hypothetical protein
MTKREQLHRWLMERGDWVYLTEVPHEQLGMSRAAASSALIALCEYDCADYRVVGLKQYKGKAVTSKRLRQEKS